MTGDKDVCDSNAKLVDLSPSACFLSSIKIRLGQHAYDNAVNAACNILCIL